MDLPQRHLRAFGEPCVVGLEPQPELVVEDTQIAVAAAHDGVRHHGLDFLRDHADIGLVLAVVGEAIEAEPVGEMAEQDHVVLERDVGAPATAAATTAAATTESAATTHADRGPRAADARMSARRAGPRDIATLDVHGIAAADVAARIVTRRGIAGRVGITRRRIAAVRLRGPVRRRTIAGALTIGRALAIARTLTVVRRVGGAVGRLLRRRPLAGAVGVAGVEHLLTVAATEVHALLGVAALVVAEALLDVGIIVAHALPVRRIMLPGIAGADVVDVEGVHARAVGDDVAVAPVDAAAPVPVVVRPASNQVTGAK